MTRKTRFVSAKADEWIKVRRGSSASESDSWVLPAGVLVIAVAAVWGLVRAVQWVAAWIAPHWPHFCVGAAVGLVLGLASWFLASGRHPESES